MAEPAKVKPEAEEHTDAKIQFPKCKELESKIAEIDAARDKARKFLFSDTVVSLTELKKYNEQLAKEQRDDEATGEVRNGASYSQSVRNFEGLRTAAVEVTLRSGLVASASMELLGINLADRGSCKLAADAFQEAMTLIPNRVKK